MEFDLRDWLLILGPVFVSGVLLHGYWRMRKGRNELKMALDKSFLTPPGEKVDVDDLDFLKAELPNGGARVTRATEVPVPAAGDGEREPADSGRLDLQKDVPVLMESVDLGEEEPAAVITPIQSPDPAERQTGASGKAPPARKPVQEKPEKFVVINVLAETRFHGQALLETLVDLGMTFGEMDIFHRLSEAGKPQFSLVNAVEPGTFDPSVMDQMETPGVMIFMRVHEVDNPVEVFDEMVSVARRLADDLGGRLLDESRSAMTAQTMENCRQGIQDFQYKYSA